MMKKTDEETKGIVFGILREFNVNTKATETAHVHLTRAVVMFQAVILGALFIFYAYVNNPRSRDFIVAAGIAFIVLGALLSYVQIMKYLNWMELRIFPDWFGDENEEEVERQMTEVDEEEPGKNVVVTRFNKFNRGDWIAVYKSASKHQWRCNKNFMKDAGVFLKDKIGFTYSAGDGQQKVRDEFVRMRWVEHDGNRWAFNEYGQQRLKEAAGA